MKKEPYITYSSTPLEIEHINAIVSNRYINESRQVSFGVIDYIPGWVLALHHHYTWELIIIDSSSNGPGYVSFKGCWWKAEPGSAVFIPKGFPHAWSSGNKKGFKMLWIYGGSVEEAGRLYDINPKLFKPITKEEEMEAVVWNKE